MKSIYASGRPYTRWWWFAGEIREDVIRYQLDWAKQMGFGGVEIAWVYPQEGASTAPRWLSGEWSQKVSYAKHYADQIGLGCDFTFGTSWPFGGSGVSDQDASQDYDQPSPQRLEKSWEWPIEGNILNHLDHTALERYAYSMGKGLKRALAGSPSALFCDSWEVITEKLWTRGFGEAFQYRFGYAIEDYRPILGAHPDERYDYRKLIADYVLDEFYKPFTEIAHQLGTINRVQCHGAPTDLLAAYATVDVPESEAILFDPEFSNIPASAAALAGQGIVSAEAFTCLYGWVAKPGPGPYQGKEKIADLKMLADALFANGVNQIIWHGMPYNPPGGSNRFYASVHVGPESLFVDQLHEFNAYMTTVSTYMRRGASYSHVAVYLPIEDTWMQGELPVELRKPSALHYWEMQYTRLPDILKGYAPLWVSLPFLKAARYEDGQLHCGDATFSALYVDVEWLDHEALDELLRLARQGLPICMTHRPRQPGRHKTATYLQDVLTLTSMNNVSTVLGALVDRSRLVRGNLLPDFWCRKEGDEYYLFFAHPKAQRLRYPLEYGQSFNDQTLQREIELAIGGRRRSVTLTFEPYQSVLLHMTRKGELDLIDVQFVPRA